MGKQLTVDVCGGCHAVLVATLSGPLYLVIADLWLSNRFQPGKKYSEAKKLGQTPFVVEINPSTRRSMDCSYPDDRGSLELDQRHSAIARRDAYCFSVRRLDCKAMRC